MLKSRSIVWGSKVSSRRSQKRSKKEEVETRDASRRRSQNSFKSPIAN
jgi:hypothetical protein